MIVFKTNRQSHYYRGFNISILQVIDRQQRQKILKNTGVWDSTINQFYVIDIYGISHPTKADFAFFLNILDHKTLLN